MEFGVWGGKGAERLGLIGDVNREDSVSLASNKTPGTKEDTLRVRTKDKLTAGYDFCFSVPKSVSIYLADAGVNRSSDNQFPIGICPKTTTVGRSGWP
jgi:conjugative relaxase-like TrwC/TraI family protein